MPKCSLWSAPTCYTCHLPLHHLASTGTQFHRPPRGVSGCRAQRPWCLRARTLRVMVSLRARYRPTYRMWWSAAAAGGLAKKFPAPLGPGADLLCLSDDFLGQFYYDFLILQLELLKLHRTSSGSHELKCNLPSCDNGGTCVTPCADCSACHAACSCVLHKNAYNL